MIFVCDKHLKNNNLRLVKQKAVLLIRISGSSAFFTLGPDLGNLRA